MRLTLAFFNRLIGRIGRSRPLTRYEQLGLVAFSHTGMLLGTLLIVSIPLSSRPPILFLICEATIIAVTLPFTISFRSRLEHMPRLSVAGEALTQEEAERKEEGENIAGKILIGASIVQFVALASLLWETGGPIESPFAEMTLIVAVFTPYIANKPKTIGIVLVASLAFYAIFIGVYTGIYPKPDTPFELAEAIKASSPAASNPPVWAYFWVNMMILIGGIAFTIFEAVLRDDEKKALDAAAAKSNGTRDEGASEAVFPGGPEDGDEETDAASAGNGASANGEASPDAGAASDADDDLDEDAAPA